MPALPMASARNSQEIGIRLAVRAVAILLASSILALTPLAAFAAQCGDYVVARGLPIGKARAAAQESAPSHSALPAHRPVSSAPAVPCHGPFCQRAPDPSPAPSAPIQVTSSDQCALLARPLGAQDVDSTPWENTSALALQDGFQPRIDEPPRYLFSGAL